MASDPEDLELASAAERHAAARALRARRTVTPREVEERGGLSAEEIGELLRSFGFPKPDPDEPCLSAEEAEVLSELGRLRELWPRKVYLQLARVYGQALAHIAQTEVQLFRLHVEGELRRHGQEGEFAHSLHDAIERLLPLADPMLTGVHRRWVEHELEQAETREAEQQGTAERLPGAVEVALLFCDLKGFTAYADASGDAAAVAAIERFTTIVEDERGDLGHIVKALGDGYMVAYPSPTAAVAAGIRMIGRAAEDGGPPVHASVHAGEAVFRDGDYFGRSVNLAARLLDVARGGELLGSEVVAEDTAEEFEWQRVGLEAIRGFTDPVEVWRLIGPRDGG